jgi:hypothetical protein
MKNEWVREFARDFIALGSIPFLILVIARVFSLNKPYYPMQFIFGAVFFFIFMVIFKAELRAGLGLIMVIFTILYYNSKFFTFFASIVYLGLICSLLYLRKDKKGILKGILLGMVSAGISYYLVKLIIKFFEIS